MRAVDIAVFILLGCIVLSVTALGMVRVLSPEAVGAALSNVVTGVFAWLSRTPSSSSSMVVKEPSS